MEAKRGRTTRPLASAFTDENGPGAQAAVSTLVPNGQVCAAMHLCTIDPSLTGPYCEMPLDYDRVCHRAVRFGPRPGAYGQVDTGAVPAVGESAERVNRGLEEETALAKKAGDAAKKTTENVNAAADATAAAAKEVGGLVGAVKRGIHQVTSEFKDAAGIKPSAPAAKTVAGAPTTKKPGKKVVYHFTRSGESEGAKNA